MHCAALHLLTELWLLGVVLEHTWISLELGFSALLLFGLIHFFAWQIPSYRQWLLNKVVLDRIISLTLQFILKLKFRISDQQIPSLFSFPPLIRASRPGFCPRSARTGFSLKTPPFPWGFAAGEQSHRLHPVSISPGINRDGKCVRGTNPQLLPQAVPEHSGIKPGSQTRTHSGMSLLSQAPRGAFPRAGHPLGAAPSFLRSCATAPCSGGALEETLNQDKSSGKPFPANLEQCGSCLQSAPAETSRSSPSFPVNAFGAF